MRRKNMGEKWLNIELEKLTPHVFCHIGWDQRWLGTCCI